MGVDEAIKLLESWRCSASKIHCVLLPSPDGGTWSVNAICVVHSVDAKECVLAFSSDASLTISMRESRFSQLTKPSDSIIGKGRNFTAKYECSVVVSFAIGSLVLGKLRTA